MGITHEWNGTVLTITSDSGTSSADLRGEKGDMGVRGPQGIKGDVGGLTEAALEPYTTKEVAANALKGNAKAAAVVIDDISPLAHEMSVKVSSKNLLDESNGAGDIVFYNASGVAQYKVGYMFPLPTGTYIISGVNKNNSSENCNIYIGINDKDNKVRALSAYQFIYNGNIKNMSFSINEGDRLIIYCSATSTDKTAKESVDAFNIQVEVGTVATPYMPYTEVEGAVVSQYGSSNLLWFKDFHYNSDARKDIMVNGVFTVSSVQDFASTNIISTTRFKAQYCGVEVFPAGTYIFSAKTINYYGTKTPYLLVKLADGTTEQFMAGEAKTVTQSFTPTSILTEEYGLYEGESYTTTFKFEVGDTATPYEPFTECIATAAVEADGTVNGLISHYPTTTLLVDKDGAQIECEYNKDLNKAYTELVQAIISLGGNV